MSIIRTYYDFGKKEGDYTSVLRCNIANGKIFIIDEKQYKVGTKEEKRIRQILEKQNKKEE